MLKESTKMKGNLCIYKCFIDVLYIFDRVFKKNWEMRAYLWKRILTIQSVLRESLLTVNLWVFE